MGAPRDRRGRLLESTVSNGIDFVEVDTDHITLFVHFLNTVVLTATVTNATIGGGETIATIAVPPVDDATDWSLDSAGRPKLRLRPAAGGDFSIYTLALTSTLLDPFFATSEFSFKAGCPSDLDCAPPPLVCPPLAGDVPPIDYLAKDFMGFRKALADFSALRYPEWQERSEADFGMMFLEALASLGDDLSYTQDRIEAEGTLLTATQRRSIVRLARLVDYWPRPATSARVLLQFDVSSGPIPAGLLVSALAPDGTAVEYETGTGLGDAQYHTVSPLWNRGQIAPYYWDDSGRCLRAGATEMWVLGHGFGFAGQTLLIDTAAANSADPPIRELVHVTKTNDQWDALFPGPPAAPTPVTHVVWDAVDALRFDHDLDRTQVAGNLVPATQGRRCVETFGIDTGSAGARALVRSGPNDSPSATIAQYLYPLRRSPLVWLAPDDPGGMPLPEIALVERPADGSPPRTWSWLRWLIDAPRFALGFTLDAARYSPVGVLADGRVQYDYDGDDGTTIRFGDGVFGDLPLAQSAFDATYRVGGGSAGNVAADAIVRVDPSAAGLVDGVTNPFPATGGADAESDERVRRLAPQAFRAVQYRAVRPADYVDAAERLPCVLRAGTAFRWTGSWLTVFTTADPRSSETITLDERIELIELLDRYRMAGYESYVLAPNYVALDLVISVCALARAFRGDVEAAILANLRAFFAVDNFTFGTSLRRGALDAAIQRVPGVEGVLSIQYRRRGVVPDYAEMDDEVDVAADEVLRVDNDPSRPERGTYKVYVEGGK
jgi:hypothetical protein